MKSPLFTAAIILLWVSSAAACMWDRDTLKIEAEANPELLEIITGRFERFPPRYYEMRLERVAEKLTGGESSDLFLYDDAGVAADRLHKGEEAIKWMNDKKVAIDKSDLAEEELKEHRYRYHANLGTFLFHHWMRNGREREALAEAKAGRDHIAKAIEINPDAHFGREIYQLKAMDWVLDITQGKKTEPSFIDYNDNAKDAINGVSGMIRLGDGWMSPDMFNNLASSLSEDAQGFIAHIALLRSGELKELGVTPLYNNDSGYPMVSFRPYDRHLPNLSKWYKKAREEADQWQEERFSFMESQFEKGMHPDTHPGFWNGYESTTSPPKPPGEPWFPWVRIIIMGVLALSMTLLLIFTSLFLLRRKGKATRSV